MSKHKVGFVQINSEFAGQVYLPLVAGYLTSFFKKYSKYSDYFDFIQPIFKRDKVENIVEKLLDCDVVAFSIYVWNEQLSLRVAERLKKLKPAVFIIFGGPQVPDEAESFLSKNSFIEICVHNEGEQTFLEILEEFINNNNIEIPNTSKLLKNGSNYIYKKIKNRPKLKDLDLIPSPFLNGYFDKLVKSYPEQVFLALWESNRGCPFSCSFCDWGSATASRVYQFELSRLLKEIEWIGKNKIPFVFVCDANFGLLPRDEEIAKYVSTIKEKYNFPEAFSTQNTKNVKERSYKVQKILSDSGLSKGVTLSMQSLHQETLELIKRDNISLSAYSDLQSKFKQDGVLTYSDLILGLPGETLASWKNGITELIKNGQHNRIQFNNLSILPNAEMANLKYRQDSGFITVQSQIVNVHGSRAELENDIPEIQELVVGSKTLPEADWIKARVYAWWVALLYFDKLFQIPLILTSNSTKIEVGHLIDKFISKLESQLIEFPVLNEINCLMIEKAMLIQKGDIEYMWDPALIDVYWPMDEYAFLKIVANGKISDLYAELQKLIAKVIEVDAAIDSNRERVILNSISLNEMLLNLPSEYDRDISLNDKDVQIIKEYFSVIMPHLDSSQLIIHENLTKSDLSFKEWQKVVVWYGHRSGEYLKKFFHKISKVENSEMAEIPGHYS
jgi:radical SAM superfamily enzyme YgiQ (UPF0313 family)